MPAQVPLLNLRDIQLHVHLALVYHHSPIGRQFPVEKERYEGGAGHSSI
jgi:hypothetical protein